MQYIFANFKVQFILKEFFLIKLKVATVTINACYYVLD